MVDKSERNAPATCIAIVAMSGEVEPAACMSHVVEHGAKHRDTKKNNALVLLGKIDRSYERSYKNYEEEWLFF